MFARCQVTKQGVSFIFISNSSDDLCPVVFYNILTKSVQHDTLLFRPVSTIIHLSEESVDI